MKKVVLFCLIYFVFPGVSSAYSDLSEEDVHSYAINYLSGENIFHFDRFWFGFLNNSVTNPKFKSIDLKSNSPPFKA